MIPLVQLEKGGASKCGSISRFQARDLILALFLLSVWMLAMMDDALAANPEEIVITFDKSFEAGLDEARVQSLLDRYGVEPGRYSFSKGALVTADVGVAVVVNRIKAYANTSESIPYFLLVLEKGKANARRRHCITQNPYAIDKTASWDVVVSREFNKKMSDKWCSFADQRNRFANLARAELIGFFDERGELSADGEAGEKLENDPDFLYALLHNGFYVYVDDLSGGLRVR